MKLEIGSRIWFSAKRRASYCPPSGEYIVTDNDYDCSVGGAIVDDEVAKKRPYYKRNFTWWLQVTNCTPLFTHVAKETKKRATRSIKAKEKRMSVKKEK